MTIMLTPKQRRFVNEYCVDENATQAAIRAMYSENSAGQIGHELLKKPEIQAAIAERQEELAIHAGITPEWVVAQWAKIAHADPNDIVQIRRTCCRYCHGFDHFYQWTPAEYAAAVDRAIASQQAAPDGMGGFEFNPNAEPAEDCPECGGLGIQDVILADTRKLTGAAKVLYAGAERTRNGIKVIMRDKDAATQNLARYLGMLVDKKELSGPNGGPLAVAGLTAADFTDEQLAAIIGATDDEEPAE